MNHTEHHYSTRSGWVRAAVLGANDGIISIAGLVIGVASTGTSQENLVLSSFSALIAGALSMGAGEYISVSAQSDIEREDIEREKHALENFPEEEMKELTEIYIDKGLTPELAEQVAKQLAEVDPLKAHLHEELNLDQNNRSRPFQACFVSFLSFLLGGILPALGSLISQTESFYTIMYGTTIGCLTLLGFFSTKLGGVPPVKGILRVLIVGVLVMIMSQSIGSLVP